MTFIWPSMLLSLLLVPLLLMLYAHALRRQQDRRAKLGRFGGTAAAAAYRPGLRRHIPPAIFLVGLVVLLVSLARPQTSVDLPRIEGTVILVFDVSGSMAAEDMEPTRLEAAKSTALEFVQQQPDSVRVGLVSFSGSGFTVQPPTDDTLALEAAIGRLQPQTGTSLGHGILVALNAIVIDAGMGTDSLEGPELNDPLQDEAWQNRSPAERIIAQLPEGTFPNAVIVLLSDGENNMEPEPLEAALAAAEREVRVNTIGFGSTAGAVLQIEGFSVHTALDEASLRQIAQATGGEYYNAQIETDPKSLFDSVTPRLVLRPEMIEVTALFAGASIIIFLLGGVLSLVWYSRLP
jgi:Ca-activated chloride channel homolog